ncbi:LysR substrate-binding domain-containing protein [Uliginosibacterium paludis]|uniref:LysR substrate-binding domain-containing protein n=1 Tax=Uliginosibacterium paludis TaxID=1615952 RepID=A0ABV2CJZ6_9RHOO
MDLRQLEYFVRVAELGSFTRAAQVLDIAQPALSRQVRMLEVELRQNLLVRNGRGATPTEAGRVLLEHGRGILHQVERVREELSRVRGGLSGQVAVGLTPSVARLLAVPLTREFRREVPEARLSISEGLTVSLLAALQTGHADVVVVYAPPSTPGIEASFLLEEDLVLVEARPPGLAEDPPPPPVTLAEVVSQPLVIPRRPHAIRMLVETECVASGLTPDVAIEIDGVGAILDLVEEGVGRAILSRHAVSRSIRPSAFRVRDIIASGGSRLHIPLYLAVSAQRPATRVQILAQDLIRKLMPGLYAG